MVSIRQELPRMPDGEPDLDVWLDQTTGFSSKSRRRAGALLDLITDEESRRLGLELVELLIGLKMDSVTAMAGMTLFAAERGEIDLDALPRDVGVLVAAVLKLSHPEVPA
ncbi:MAG: hypothetical protein OXH68_06805, partial [Gammaproteobacteria bacterium]|nr:hypothetical protein [Gammaproteobacteria bacterium]